MKKLITLALLGMTFNASASSLTIQDQALAESFMPAFEDCNYTAEEMLERVPTRLKAETIVNDIKMISKLYK